jgi:hypothetical protein
VAITPVSATIPTVVFVPSTAGMPHAFLYNTGPAPVYLGGSGVSTNVGFTLAAGDKLDLSYNGGTIWAISGYQTTSPQGTVITATTTAGGTTLTNAAGTSFTAGMWIAIETGTPRQEIAQVNGSNAGSVFTNGPLTYCHGTAATFWQITSTPTVVRTSHVGAT